MSDPPILSIIDLPLASVGRIVKTGLPNHGKSINQSMKLSKEVKMAMSRAGGIFALYLAQSAIESAKMRMTSSSSRVNISGDDVIAALEEIEFEPLIEPCLTFLKGKKSKSNKTSTDQSTKTTSNKKSNSSKSTKSTNQSTQPKKKAPVKRKASTNESSAPKKKKVEEVINDEEEEEDHEPANVPSEDDEEAELHDD